MRETADIAPAPIASRLTRAPLLVTPRLRLRSFRAADLDAVAALYGDAQTTRYLPFGLRDRAQSAAALAHYRAMWREHGYGFWAVEAREDWAFLGVCGFVEQGEIGYAFMRETWGRGFATEAARACLRYGFRRLGWEVIGAAALHENTASLHVMEKLGMRRAPNPQFDEHGGAWFQVARAAAGPTLGTR